MARFEHIEEYESDLEGHGLRVGIAMSRFNQNIGEGLLSACIEELARLKVPSELIRVATVAGALELPLVLQTMARSGRFDALIALGAVVRGETYHFEIVANEMAAGLSRVALDAHMPVANGVLTTEDDDQALARMSEKGRDCARVAVEMANLIRALK